MNATNEISRNAVRFICQAYVNSHGKMPRGRGGWMFCPADKWGGNDYLAHCANFNGTFAEAKNEARDFFAVRGVQFVTVCS